MMEGTLAFGAKTKKGILVYQKDLLSSKPFGVENFPYLHLKQLCGLLCLFCYSFMPIHNGGETDLRFVYCAGKE